MMKTIQIKKKSSKYFNKAWDIYQNSFPSNEKRFIEEQVNILKKEEYVFQVYLENENIIAILMYWDINNFTFIEHFAINKDFRSNKYGSKILSEFIKCKNIILEIDLLRDSISLRRYEFYKKLGFYKYEYKHFQIPFRENEKELELLILSNNRDFTFLKYEIFISTLKKYLL